MAPPGGQPGCSSFRVPRSTTPIGRGLRAPVAHTPVAARR
jgi:hypothetical protein